MMFKELHIDNFRGIRNCNINEFRHVNVFFGKNNCGKSSLLEALFLLSGQSNPLLPISITSMRNYACTSVDDLLLDFYKCNADACLRIASDNRSLEIRFVEYEKIDIPIKEINEGTSAQKLNRHGLQLNFQKDRQEYQSEVIFDNNDTAKLKVTVDKLYKEDIQAVYLPSSYMQITLIDKLAKIIENKEEVYILESLRSIEPKIKDIVLADKKILVDIGETQRLPINVMGDGIRKMLAIIIAIYECRGGMVMIDEIDNGFHYSAMPLLWKAILMAAAKNKTQVFATTHNADSLKGLVKTLQNDEIQEMRSNISSYKLIKKDTDELVCLHYDYEKMQYSLEQEMEIR